MTNGKDDGPDGPGGLGDAAPMGAPGALVSPRGLARNLAVSTDTVKRLVERRQIPYVRVGGRYRFDVAAVRRALIERTEADDAAKKPAGK